MFAETDYYVYWIGRKKDRLRGMRGEVSTLSSG
jgi:hypothetical protein